MLNEYASKAPTKKPTQNATPIDDIIIFLCHIHR